MNCTAPHTNRFLLRATMAILAALTAAAPVARAADAPAPEPAVAMPAPVKINFLDLSKMQITDVLKILSDTSEANIIPGKGVTGEVYAYLKDIEVETALEKIVEAYDLRFVREGNTVTVMTEDVYEKRYGPLRQHRIFRLRYSRPELIAPLLSSALSTAGSSVTPDTANNQIIVYDYPNRFDAIAALVEQLDRPEETRVIALQNAAVYSIYTAILPLVGNPANVSMDERTNRLIVTDTPYHLDRLEKIIRELDLEDLTETRTYALRYAAAQQVADLLIEMLTGRRSGAGQGATLSGGSARPATAALPARPQNSGIPAPTRDESRSTLSSSVTRADGERQLMASAPSQPVGPAGDGAPGAVEAAASAAPMMEAEAAALGEARALGVQGSVTADPRTNTVVVTHTPGVLDRIEKVIAALDVELPLMVYQFEHADLELLGIDEKLAGLLPNPEEEYYIDSSTRKVAFRAPYDRASYILALFQEWDQLTPQVHIEARILRVALDLIRDVGVSLRVNDQNADGGSNAIVDILFPPSITGSTFGKFQFGDLTSDEYTVILQLLESDSRSKLLSNPKVTVLDRHEAQFQVAVDQPFTESIETNTGSLRDSTRFIPVGVTLNVFPAISSLGLIQMDVRVEVSSLLGRTANDIPIVDRSEARSSVTVRDGHTLAIGGLILDEKMERINRVPVLGSIPLIKHLFRNTSVENRQSELLLFLTPVIAHTGAPQKPPVQLNPTPSPLVLRPPAEAPIINSKKLKFFHDPNAEPPEEGWRSLETRER